MSSQVRSINNSHSNQNKAVLQKVKAAKVPEPANPIRLEPNRVRAEKAPELMPGEMQ